MSVTWRMDKHALLSRTGGQTRLKRSIALEPRSTVLEEGCRRNVHTKASSHATFLIGNLKERQAMKAGNKSVCPELGTEASMGYKHTGVIREVTQMRK